MKNSLFFFAFVLSCLIPSIHAEESRTWTNKQGKTVAGILLNKTDKSVSIKLPNGKTATIPLAQLSEEDNAYVATWSPESGEEKTSGNTEGGKVTAEEVKSNFDTPWPKLIKIPIKQNIITVQEGPELYIYETDHFRFESDAKLNGKLMSSLSHIFESTFEANCSLPLNSLCLQRKDKNAQKYQAKLYESKEDYMQASGAPPSSAGVYYKGVVHVPFISLGLKKVGQQYTIDRQGDPHTLIHEITHQMTLGATYRPESRPPTWFTEGIAEYVGYTPYKNGTFNFGATKTFLVAGVTEYGKKNTGGRAMGDEFSFMPLREFMNLEHQQFMTGNAQHNYGFSALLTYYFFHIDGKGDAARIKKYLQAFQEAQGREKANEALLDGRSWEELQKEVSLGMSRQLKVKVNFKGY